MTTEDSTLDSSLDQTMASTVDENGNDESQKSDESDLCMFSIFFFQNKNTSKIKKKMHKKCK